ncbi:hypothetical protein [Archangium violaceum]|uniref:Uncharacterized protein n=1 Tax=Archangium violaceum Cb vi76 TaxID=1406225 RepID=A0A084SE21_9BACT|nr:hypothetical protein [Archangium violaceum]KFA86706.1 hypothetical protein Q664_52805 [Archangium violaceum Cb vi76]
MSPLRLLLIVAGAVWGVRLANDIADAIEGEQETPAGPGQAARRVELEEKRELLEAELQGVRIVRELPADAGTAEELPALPFGLPREPAKA